MIKQLNKTLKSSKVVRVAISIFALVLFTQLISAVNDFDSYRPYLHKASVEDVPKLQAFGEYQTELFQGAGSYLYVLELPFCVCWVDLSPVEFNELFVRDFFGIVVDLDCFAM